MTELGLATVVLLASLALTYFFCIRPMRQGRCAMAPKAQAEQARSTVDDEGEIARLRVEVAALRAETLTRNSDSPV
ncbi:hypothetical protein [Cryobacterium sp. TMS1-13-1]|uniref:hypothetical protein n=1 Tax=Cryobacterium sp. TMS1-13-1 TaxID=1259220 RepID=UPI001069D20A|nr:hypothetical protein [Cryobacterium sp. TMS1-13-1]TFD21515.1 hypothetical protein E3T31_12040 [Cryobacterium sp. TMS1-13-1]